MFFHAQHQKIYITEPIRLDQYRVRSQISVCLRACAYVHACVRRRVAREPEAQPGVLGRVFQGIMTALVAALVGALAATFRAVLGAPGRAIARLFGGKKRRVRKRRRR